uniref:NTR domain-containing protein n=1 Tax=Rhabditophanes sp. KR3021 TaxID=114890 RepID=A0AC35TVH4_9BILA
MRYQNILYIFCILTLNLKIVSGCKCSLESPQNNYCRAEWVSHVKIISHKVVTVNDTKHIFHNSNQVIYTVDHLNVFKCPRNISIGVTIFTPKESASCGLDVLENDHEYLLSGGYESNIFTTTLCGQILANNKSRDIVQQWNDVQELQRQILKNNGYEPCVKMSPAKELNNSETININPTAIIKEGAIIVDNKNFTKEKESNVADQKGSVHVINISPALTEVREAKNTSTRI